MFANNINKMILNFSSIIKQFGKKGEKSGWTYIEIPSRLAAKLKPNTKKSFYVKGKLDKHELKRTALLPMGNGDFILPLNAAIRKATGKRKGAVLNVQLQEDKTEFIFNPDFIACLKDDPEAWIVFRNLAGSHQRYFSKWIDTAKTETTKAKRIAMAVNALFMRKNFGQMLRDSAARKIT